MQRVSSQLTIVLRIALPTIWLTTILSLVFLLALAVQGKAGIFGNPFIWVGLVLILGSGIALIKFLFWRLYRVDIDDQYIYVSNYFKTYRYTFADVEGIRDSKIVSGRIFCIHLKAKGSFGQHLYFLASRVLWLDVLASNPQVRNLLREENDTPSS